MNETGSSASPCNISLLIDRHTWIRPAALCSKGFTKTRPAIHGRCAKEVNTKLWRTNSFQNGLVSILLLCSFLLPAVEGNGAWRRWKRLLLSNWVLFDAVVEKDVSAAYFPFLSFLSLSHVFTCGRFLGRGG